MEVESKLDTCVNINEHTEADIIMEDESEEFDDDTTYYRVKIYHLTPEGDWLDQGCGDIYYVENTDEGNENTDPSMEYKHALLVREVEAPRSEILLSPIIHSQSSVYTKQGDSIIIWIDPVDGMEKAVSFASIEYCDLIWTKIHEDLPDEVDTDGIHSNNTNTMTNGVRILSIDDDDDDDDFAEIMNSSDSDHLISGGVTFVRGAGAGNSPFRSQMSAFRGGGADNNSCNKSMVTFTLPSVEIEKLGIISQAISTCTTMKRKRTASDKILLNECEYVKQLFELLMFAEDLEDEAQLTQIFMIFRNMILLNNETLITMLFSDEFYLNVLKALTFDPEISQANRIDHAKHFENKSLFKETIPIRDEEVLKMIHLNFRLQYVLDTVLAKIFDDSIHGVLQGMISMQNQFIVRRLYVDEVYLGELFRRLNNPINTEETMNELLSLIHTYCVLLRGLPLIERENAFKRFILKDDDYSIIHVVERVLANIHIYKSRCAVRCFELLLMLIQQDHKFFRQYILDMKYPTREMQSSSLYEQLVKMGGNLDVPLVPTVDNITKDSLKRIHFIHGKFKGSILYLTLQRMLFDEDQGVQGQAAELVQILFDAENVNPIDSGGLFLRSFYEFYIDNLLHPFLVSSTDHSTTGSRHSLTRGIREGMYHSIELLGYCVTNHGFRVKYRIFKDNILSKILETTLSDEKYLVLAGIRFLRCCIQVQDDFYNKYIIKNDLFRPVIQAFKLNGSRNNMINSSVIELLEFILKQNIQEIGQYIVESYKGSFDGLTYVQTFKQFIEKFDKSIETSDTMATETSEVEADGTTPVVTGGRAFNIVDVNEENYFSSSNIDEEEEDIHDLDISNTDTESAGSIADVLANSSKRKREEESASIFDSFISSSSSSSSSSGPGSNKKAKYSNTEPNTANEKPYLNQKKKLTANNSNSKGPKKINNTMKLKLNLKMKTSSVESAPTSSSSSSSSNSSEPNPTLSTIIDITPTTSNTSNSCSSSSNSSGSSS